MIPELDQTSWVMIAYWVLMFPIAVYVLMVTANFWADDGPGTVFETIRTTVVTGLVIFLSYDLLGYMLARIMESPQLGIVFPPDYGYWNWIREPLCLKWQVLSFVPVVRYLPILFALFLGGTLQVVWWKIEFRQGLLGFISQIILNILAMSVLSLIFVFFLGIWEGANSSSTSANSNDRRASNRSRNQRDRAPQRANQADNQLAANITPDGLQELQRRVREIGQRKGPFARGVWEW